jgi:hypothetical protein
MSDALANEIKAFEKMKPELIKNHSGKFVIIRNGKLEGVFDSFNNAAEEALKKFGKGPYLIRQVNDEITTLPASVAYRIVECR